VAGIAEHRQSAEPFETAERRVACRLPQDIPRMNRTGLWIALAVAVVAGLAFGLYPDLDLRLAGLFYHPERPGPWAGSEPLWQHLRDASRWLVALIAAPAFVALVLKLILPRRRLLMSGRAVLFLVASLAVGPGIVANAIFKENWGRTRPVQVTQFGGDKTFVAWWDPRGACPKNCSFVAGEPSGAFWTLAPAALAPPQWRALAYGGAIAFGVGVGLVRMAAGGHFASDVAFAGVFMFLTVWLLHGLIYRWPRTRLAHESVERAIERIALPAHDGVRHAFARLGVLARRPFSGGKA
jgi:lipid A 4'-phosphatase